MEAAIMQHAECETEYNEVGEFQAFDSAARYFVHMSGHEFLRKWTNGEFENPDAIPGVMEVASLIPSNLS